MKKLFTSAMCVLMTILLFAGMCSPALAAADFNGKAMDGVVFIFWQGVAIRDNESGVPVLVEGSVSGSGFFVGKSGDKGQYIVTNYHVVEEFVKVDDVVRNNADILKNYYDVYNKTGKTLFPLYVCYDQGDYEEAYIVDYDTIKDIAILKIASPTDKRSPLKLRKSSEDLVGKSVWAVGFPGVADMIASSVTSYGKNDATVTIGSINRIYTESGTGTTMYQTDAKVRGGNSGGPLVDEKGNVLGINTWVAFNEVDPNLNYAVSTNDLLPLLDKNSVKYELYTPPSFWEEYMLYILIGGGVLLIVLIVVLLLVILSGKKKKAAPAPAEPVIVAAPPMAQTPAVIPVLHSMSSQHGGMTVQLSAGPITIGRDVASCRVVFREGTNGISSRHCQIYFDSANNNFVLTDLKSTYGTFLSSGQKLTPNVPYILRPRESFYLGEQDNSMYVDLQSTPSYR